MLTQKSSPNSAVLLIQTRSPRCVAEIEHIRDLLLKTPDVTCFAETNGEFEFIVYDVANADQDIESFAEQLRGEPSVTAVRVLRIKRESKRTQKREVANAPFWVM